MFHELPPKAPGIAFGELTWAMKTSPGPGGFAPATISQAMNGF
jgi:hypothetical protein